MLVRPLETAGCYPSVEERADNGGMHTGGDKALQTPKTAQTHAGIPTWKTREAPPVKLVPHTLLCPPWRAVLQARGKPSLQTATHTTRNRLRPRSRSSVAQGLLRHH